VCNLLIILVSILIRAYQIMVSPFLGHRCRFYPSCSQYVIDCIMAHGLVRGAFLAVGRLARCHPLSDGGYDPVDVASQKQLPTI